MNVTHLSRRLAPWLLGAYVAFMVGFSFAGVDKLSYYGDELIHLEKLKLFLEHGYYALTGGENAQGELLSTRGHLYSYGPLFTLTAHAIAVLLGADAWGVVGFSDTSFAIRHAVVVLFSLAGVFAAGWAVTLVTRSRLWGLGAASILVSIPMWTGSAMFNLKDTPIATGFTLFTAGLIALNLPGERETSRIRRSGWIAVYAGTLIFWGVRPGIWPAIVLGLIAMVLIRGRWNHFSQWKRTLSSLIHPITAIAASYTTMVAIYPKVFLNPVVLLYRSFKDTTSFPHNTRVLTDGELLKMPPPWYYLPKWVAAQLPEVLLVLLVGAIVLAIWIVLRRLFRRTESVHEFAFPALVFVFIQLAAFPTAAVLLKSTIYGGLRQFVFMFPAIAMLIAIGLHVVVRTLSPRTRRVAVPVGLSLLVASTSLTTVTQLQMFPYVTSYFNPTTVAAGIDERWDVYAWKLAHGELYSKLSDIERTRCRKACPPLDSFPTRFAAAALDQTDELKYWEIVRYPENRTLPQSTKSCDTVVATVRRDYLWTTIPIIRATACPVHTSALVPTPDNDRAAKRWWKNYGRWGWESASAEGLTAKIGARSALAWTEPEWQPDEVRSYSLTVSLGEGSDESAVVSITVNGIAFADVPIAAGGEVDVVIPVVAPTQPDAPVDATVIEFATHGGESTPVSNPLSIRSLVRIN